MMGLPIRFEPLLSIELIVLCALAALAVCLTTLRRCPTLSLSKRVWLFAWRLLAVCGLVIVLLGPVTTSTQDQASKATFRLLMDTSASMNHDDIQPSRYRHAMDRWLGPKQLEALRAHADLAVFTFDRDLRATNLGALSSAVPTGSHTRLIDAVQRQLRSNATHDPLIIFTDGHDNQHAADSAATHKAISLAQAKGIPLYTVPLGEETSPVDLRVELHATPQAVFEDEPANLTATIHQAGLEQAPVSVSLTADGVPLQTIHTNIDPARTTQQVTFTHTPKGNASIIDYQVNVPTLDGEAHHHNNTAHALVRMTGRRIHVLLLEGEPHWDTRFFSQAMLEDPQVSLTRLHAVTADHVIMSRVGDDENIDVPIALPLTDATLREFDVLALGRGMSWFFPGDQAETLKRFATEHGGGMVFIRGHPFDPSDPAAQSHVTPLLALTDEIRLPVIQREAPQAGPPAVAAMARAGRGRALTIRNRELWRWAMHDDASGAYPAAYRSFVGDGVRWAAVGDGYLPTQPVSIAADRMRAEAGLQRTLRMRLRDAAMLTANSPALKVTAPDGQVSSIALQPNDDDLTYTGIFTPDQPGIYTAAFGDYHTKLLATHADLEQADVSVRRALLHRLSSETGGRMLLDPEELLNAVSQQQRHAHGSAAGPTTPAWDRTWVFTLLIGALSIDWFTRRMMGLA